MFKIPLQSITLTLLIIAFCILTVPVLAQRGDKTILLNGVDTLPLPNNYNILPTFIIGYTPQIIATAQYKAESINQINAIVTSRLQKGRVAVFGSPAYFTPSYLNNTNVRTLVLNTVKWGDQKKSKTIQLPDTGRLQKLLVQNGYHVIISHQYMAAKSVGVIVITKDVHDAADCKNLEAFIREGGTLILGSAFIAVDNSFKVNDILEKAGLYINGGPAEIVKNYNRLITDDIPNYLHISTIFQALETNQNIPWAQDQLENMINCLSLALLLEPLNSSIVIRVLKATHLDTIAPIIPSPHKPLIKNSRNYMTYQLQLILRDKQAAANPLYTDPASKTFPGTVADTAARVNTQIVIPVRVGTDGLWQPEPIYYRWHSTGLYVPAGEKVTVTIDNKYKNQHLKAQIGVHDDDLTHTDEYTRTPYDLTKSFELDNSTTTIYSPYGGILLLKIADSCTLKNISITVNGAVKYPYFKLGTTTPAQWKAIRNYGAPWAELATDKLILTVPANRIRQLDDPTKVLKFWDEVMDADARLADIPADRKHPERMISDIQVAYGYMFTTEYKCVVPDNDNATTNMLNEEKMRRDGSWGHFHELGHRHQFWWLDFEGTGEVTVNLFSMYILDKVLHHGIYSPPNISDKQTVINQIKAYMAGKPTFAQWKDDPFLALKMYIELIEGFGWGPIEQVYRNFRAIQPNEYPKTNSDKRDLWFVQISKATQKNLGAFFDKWKVPVSKKAKKEVAGLPEWLPDELK